MDIYGVILDAHRAPRSPAPLVGFRSPVRAWADFLPTGKIWPAVPVPHCSTRPAPPSTQPMVRRFAAADPFSNTSYTVTSTDHSSGNQTAAMGASRLLATKLYLCYAPGRQPSQGLTPQVSRRAPRKPRSGQGAKYTCSWGYSGKTSFTSSFLEDSWSTDDRPRSYLLLSTQWSSNRTDQRRLA